jgi:lycopene cyclase domain-containing protein
MGIKGDLLALVLDPSVLFSRFLVCNRSNRNTTRFMGVPKTRKPPYSIFFLTNRRISFVLFTYASLFYFSETLLEDYQKMTPYIAYNLALAVFVLPISYWFVGSQNRVRNIILSARIALLVTLISYPWDFFAIHAGIWRYPYDPGWKIYDVPINDLVFIWLGTYLSCCVLIAANRWKTGKD